MTSEAEKLQPDRGDEDEGMLELQLSDDDEDDWLCDYTDSESLSGLLADYEKDRFQHPSAPTGPLRAALRELLTFRFEDHMRQDKNGMLELNLLIDMIDRDEYVPPLQDTAREFVLFGATKLFPFFHKSHPDEQPWGPKPPIDCDTFTFAYFKIAYWAQFNLKARWKCKLLRSGQIKLVEVLMKRLMSELDSIIADSPREPEFSWDTGTDLGPRWSKSRYRADLKEYRKRLDNLKVKVRAAILIRSGLVDFLSSERFRSERLETLILTYLTEDHDAPPDTALVLGIQQLTISRTNQYIPYYFARLLTGEREADHPIERPEEWRPHKKMKPIVRPVYPIILWDPEAGTEAP